MLEVPSSTCDEVPGSKTRRNARSQGLPPPADDFRARIVRVAIPLGVSAVDTFRRDATVAASGNTGGLGFAMTVLPFILRAVALVGIDSVPVPIAERRAIWQRLGDDLRPIGPGDGVTEVTLDTLDDALDGILAGHARGRWLVRIGS